MLDIEEPDALASYLRSVGWGEPAAMEVLHGGVSNRVVLVRWSLGTSWVIKQALPKLRVAVDWYSSPERVHREALALDALSSLGVSVPRLEFEDQHEHLVAMEAVPEPHENWKAMLLAGQVHRRHVRAFAAMLAAIHSRSALRRSQLEGVFRDVSYFESLRIEPYYLYTAQQVPAAAVFMRQVVDATRSNRVCLVHGDFSPKNVLIRDDRLVLLDYEVCHWGDPAFDLGFALTHFLSKAHHLLQHRAKFEGAALDFWSEYWAAARGEPSSEALQARTVDSTIACLLARVAGRSPLEYLSADERMRQRNVVLQLIASPPESVVTLVGRFVNGVSELEVMARS